MGDGEYLSGKKILVGKNLGENKLINCFVQACKRANGNLCNMHNNNIP